jgi:hypothetical protein
VFYQSPLEENLLRKKRKHKTETKEEIQEIKVKIHVNGSRIFQEEYMAFKPHN